MSGLLIITALSWWHFHKLADKAYWAKLLLDTLGYPHIVYRNSSFGDDTKYVRVHWNNGADWIYDTLPAEIRCSWDFYWVRMDSLNHLHIVNADDGDTVFFASETDTSWKYYSYFPPPPTGYCRPIAFDATKDGTPHLIVAYSSGVFHVWMEGDTWASEKFVNISTDSIMAYQGDARFDRRGNLHLAVESVGPDLLWYGFRDSSCWQIDTVEDLTGQGADFNFSWCIITVDWWETPYIYYYPFYYPPGIYRNKYAELTPFGWIAEFTNMDNSCYLVTPDSLIHTLNFHGDSMWNVVRHGPNDWEELEYITQGTWGRLATDENGYLHLIYSPGSWGGELWYATTNPEIVVSESSSKPGQNLILLMASSGFWITGYSDEARIYDPAGRLILSKEIKGKTLIGPLRPGVYFVVAGKQRARVAIR